MLPVEHSVLVLGVAAALTLQHVVKVLDLTIQILMVLFVFDAVRKLFSKTGNHFLQTVHQLLLQLLKLVKVELAIDLVLQLSMGLVQLRLQVLHSFLESADSITVFTARQIQVRLAVAALLLAAAREQSRDLLLKSGDAIERILEVLVQELVELVAESLKVLANIVDLELQVLELVVDVVDLGLNDAGLMLNFGLVCLLLQVLLHDVDLHVQLTYVKGSSWLTRRGITSHRVFEGVQAVFEGTNAAVVLLTELLEGSYSLHHGEIGTNA